MSVELWQPSGEDWIISQDAYIKYLGGVTLLQDPHSDVARGLLGPPAYTEGTSELVVAHAETLMYQGLKDLILCTAPAAAHRSLGAAEGYYAQTLLRIMNVVDETCVIAKSRLNDMNPAFTTIRPMPLVERTMYNFFCHGRKSLISTVKLMHPYLAAPELQETLNGRTLSGERAAESHYTDKA